MLFDVPAAEALELLELVLAILAVVLVLEDLLAPAKPSADKPPATRKLTPAVRILKLKRSPTPPGQYKSTFADAPLSAIIELISRLSLIPMVDRYNAA